MEKILKGIALTCVVVGVAGMLSEIAKNRSVNPSIRFIASTVAGDLYHDAESGTFFIA
ncbi:MAG: hypothetical protein ABSF45_09040 [Terriglobia bacterium]|jgi:hypothetical protein